MKITVRQSNGKPIFIAESTYEEKNLPYHADFWWHPGNETCRRNSCAACNAEIGKTWWTPFPEKAVRLIEYADDAAKAVLEETTKATSLSLK